MNTIEFKQVTKRFGGIQALEEVTLDVEPDEFVSLIGPSGCGKTTLLRIAAGLEIPSYGKVRVNGDTPLLACRKHQIGVAFQRPALIPSRTALQNICLTLEITGQANCLSPERLLADFGLEHFMHHYPHELSGGMLQRVNIACALVHNPSILLLDEPFGALDELTREQMGEWLSNILATSQKTIMFVTHSVEEAVFLSDRVVIFSERPGRITDILNIRFSKPRQKTLRIQENFLEEVKRVRETFYSVPNGGKP